MMRLARTPLVLAAAATALTLAACGGDDGGQSAGLENLSAKEIVQKAAAALDGAQSVRYVGEGTDDGDAISINVHINSAGELTGSMTNGDETMELRRLGDTLYLNGSILRQIDPSLDPSKWVAFPVDASGDGAPTSLSRLSIPEMSKDFADIADDPDARVEAATEQGKPVVRVSTATETLVVANADPARPLQHITREDDGDEVTVTFSDYDKAVEVSEPDGAVSLKELATAR